MGMPGTTIFCDSAVSDDVGYLNIGAEITVLGDAGDARGIMFTLVIGALIATVQASGGVQGFVEMLEQRFGGRPYWDLVE